MLFYIRMPGNASYDVSKIKDAHGSRVCSALVAESDCIIYVAIYVMRYYLGCAGKIEERWKKYDDFHFSYVNVLLDLTQITQKLAADDIT